MKILLIKNVMGENGEAYLLNSVYSKNRKRVFKCVLFFKMLCQGGLSIDTGVRIME